MSEAFLIRRGGTANAFAAIGVTYPAGSSCSCTCGSTVLKAKDTSGSCLFLIPAAGTWAISCTDGTNTDSRSVKISAKWQSEKVVLSYGLWIFDPDRGGINPAVVGDFNTAARPGVTGGSASISNKQITVTANYGGSDAGNHYGRDSKLLINLTNYKTLWVTGHKNSANTGIQAMTRFAPTHTDAQIPTELNFSSTAEQTLSLDISGVNGSYYLRLSSYTGAGTGSAATGTWTKIWLK